MFAGQIRRAGKGSTRDGVVQVTVTQIRTISRIVISLSKKEISLLDELTQS